jgi:hypothetical protein
MLSSQGKLRETKRLTSGWAAAVLAIALAGCGGGGSAGAPPPGPAPEPPPPPAAAQLEGRLWHNDFSLDTVDGTEISSLDGKLPVLASTNSEASPWPDGTQFVITDSGRVYGQTDLKVIALASGQALYSLTTAGYLRGANPSPVDKTLLMATLGDDSISPADTIFIDLTTMTVLRRFSAEAPVNWLPDGRYMRVLSDGTMRVGDVNGAEVDAGRIQPPAGHTARALWISPRGDRITWSIAHVASTPPENDIWISDLDGSHLERITQTKMSNYAVWSPDSSKIAFDVDSGSVCAGGGCMGGCELWWVPITSRNVIAVPASGDAWRFTVKDRHGSDHTLLCELMGWTR